MDDKLRLALTDLIDTAADEGISRALCRDRASRLLETLGLASDDREKAWDWAVVRIDRNSALTSDVADGDKIDEAARILGAIAQHLRTRPVHATVLTRWPAPIAHEYARLVDEMSRSTDTAQRRMSSPDAALMQVRDVYEVLIKFSAIVLVRWLIELSATHAEWAREWAIPLRNELAASLQSRGNAKRDSGTLHEAIADYDTAVAIRQDLRAILEPQGQWPIPLRNELAGSLQNRGIAKQDRGALAEAIADYNIAIAIKQDLRTTLEPQGQWAIPLRNDLAASLQNRGNATQLGGKPSEAIVDYDAAITIRQDLRAILESQGQWTIPLRNDLAKSFQNRGAAKYHGGALPQAIADYETAIAIRQDLREVLEPHGQWAIPLRHDLAELLVNRFIALEKADRIAESKADLTEAIAIQRQALALAGANAPTRWRDQLATWQAWLKEM